ncbi:MAG: 50S ribosomal protein L9 [bacterium]
MKVILRETYESLGRPGDVVNVKPGFARNFLVPQGIAYLDNAFYRRRFENERDDLLKRDAELRSAAEAVAKKGEGSRIEFIVRVGERGQMFGAITNRDIAAKLEEQGIKVDRRKISLSEPIKTTGEHSVVVKPHGDVAFDVFINVIPEVTEEELLDEKLAIELAEAMGKVDKADQVQPVETAGERAERGEGAEIVEVEPVEKPETSEEVTENAEEKMAEGDTGKAE